METINLKYGKGSVEIPVKGAKSVEMLLENPMREISDIKKEFINCVTAVSYTHLDVYKRQGLSSVEILCG